MQDHESSPNLITPLISSACARCGQPAIGHAFINDERYCQGDVQRTSCYMRQLAERIFNHGIIGDHVQFQILLQPSTASVSCETDAVELPGA